MYEQSKHIELRALCLHDSCSHKGEEAQGNAQYSNSHSLQLANCLWILNHGCQSWTES